MSKQDWDDPKFQEKMAEELMKPLIAGANYQREAMKILKESFTVQPMSEEDIEEYYIKVIGQQLTPDLLKGKYKGTPNKYRGHCYVASETLYHLLGGANSGYTPYYISMRNDTHWFLKDRSTGKILDPTVDQFDEPPNYDKGRPCGFLTKGPSQRALTLMKRVQGK